MAKFLKTETLLFGALIVVLAVYMGWMSIPGINFTAGNIGGGGGGGGNPVLEAVNKPIKFTVINPYDGAAQDSDADGLKIYTSDLVPVESLNTDAAGQATTSNSYASGAQIYALYAHDSSRQWYQITVPKLSAADADSLTTTPITLKTYDYTAPTLSVRTANNATVIADAGEYNQTIGGASPVFTVSWFEGTDGQGYISSFDPVYGIKNEAVLVVKVSNTNYDQVSLSGFDGSKESGSAMYYWKALSDETLTKWKVGDSYRYPGTGSFSFSASLSGYSGDAADMDIYIYYNADPSWFVSHNNWGPNALSVISGAPHTVNMEEGD